MDMQIRGLRVLISAGAGGIGLEIARAFLREGARVHICDVDREAISALSRQEPDISATYADVAKREDVDRLFREMLTRLGGLDVLINNAGIAGPTGRVEEINPEDWDRCLEICLTGQFNCTRLAVAHLKQSDNASIINLSSVAGRLGFGLRSPYAAAKWGVIGFTKSLAIELGEFGIRVNAILPGIVQGDRIRRVFESKGQARGVAASIVEAEALSYVSLQSMVSPQQLAEQIVFLCSPRGRMISGQAISICGDLQMMS